jgi:uncharacterized protein (DUF1330 family)
MTRILSLCAAALLAVLATAAGGYAQNAAAAAKAAYYISEFHVNDPEGIKPYSAQVESTFRPFGGRFVVRGGGDIASLEGAEQHDRVVIIVFDSKEKALAWYNSPEYSRLRPIRHRTAKSRVFIVEGLPL